MRVLEHAGLQDNRALPNPRTMHAELPHDHNKPAPDAAVDEPKPAVSSEAEPALVADDGPVTEPASAAGDAPPAEPTTAASDMSPAEATKAAGDLSPAACGAKLAELFPALFQPVSAAPPQPVKPIKLRIQADIMARAPGLFTKRILGIYFSRYTTSNAYLKALTQAPSRFDLDGNPSGEIDIEHRTAAVQELARRREIAQAKRQAEMQAQRERQRAEGAPSAPAEGAANDAPPRTEPQRERPPRRNDERRPPVPPRQEREQRGPRAPMADDRRPRSPRPDNAPRGDGPNRPDQSDRMDRRDHAPRAAPPAEPAMPADPAMRERALLLRSFESSSLSKANFCALKRLNEAELDAQLEQARAERGGTRKTS